MWKTDKFIIFLYMNELDTKIIFEFFGGGCTNYFGMVRDTLGFDLIMSR